MSTLVILSCDDCGHATPATSPAMAAYALRRHSCATVLERVARGQRRLDRLALSGPEQPCQHNDRHPHGDRVRYVIDKCRCRPCRDSANRYERARQRQQMYGHDAYVDAGPARAHITALMAAGMGLKRIVAVSDISQGLLWKLIYGKRRADGTRTPSKRIRPTTEAVILAITLDLADGARVSGVGTRRRLQALVAVGWSQSKLARRLGMGGRNFGHLIHNLGLTGEVTVTHAKAVTALYDQLWDQLPPHTQHRDHIAYSRAINHAIGYDWPVPMAWDEDDIDDPDAQPDRGEQQQRRGTGRPVEFSIEDIDFILDNDPLTIDQLADRLKVSQDTIKHHLARSGRRDLLARMLRNKTVQEYAA
jgi:predicted ArsR family transcriptional regulator